MCGGSSPSPAPAPAAAPPPPSEGPAAPIVNETKQTDRNLVSSTARGRNSLRIDLAGGGALGDTAGLNIPTG